MIDCDKSNNGCVGGIATSGITYIRRSGGLQKRKTYPYKGHKGTCKFNRAHVAFKVKGWYRVPTNNEEYIKKFLYKNGPLSVAVNGKFLQFYRGGIIDTTHANCDPMNMNHAVNIVGYGVSPRGTKYWIVRNTYGPNWGENGYFRMSRGKGTCGINNFIITGILA